MQDKISTYSEPLVLGAIADSSLQQIDSYAAEEEINFGFPVMRGTDSENQVKKLITNNNFLGIALLNKICKKNSYSKNDIVSVLTKGRVIISLRTEEVKKGDIAYISKAGVITNNLLQEALQ
jgi:hypothetical protein